jgi:DedD protein
MDDGIKQRLIGAIVLVALMIIFLPMFFGDRDVETVDILIEMPAKPEIPEFDISKPLAPNEKQIANEQPEVEKQEEEKPEVAKPETNIKPAPALEMKQQAAKDLQELAGKKVDANNLPVSWTLQVASFKERSNAENLRDKLRKGGYKAYIKFMNDVEPKMIRVFVGPVLERKTIDDIKASISKQHKLDGVVVRYLP